MRKLIGELEKRVQAQDLRIKELEEKFERLDRRTEEIDPLTGEPR
jgi:chaperonin cofactor prefoldin